MRGADFPSPSPNAKRVACLSPYLFPPFPHAANSAPDIATAYAEADLACKQMSGVARTTTLCAIASATTTTKTSATKTRRTRAAKKKTKDLRSVVTQWRTEGVPLKNLPMEYLARLEGVDYVKRSSVTAVGKTLKEADETNVQNELRDRMLADALREETGARTDDEAANDLLAVAAAVVMVADGLLDEGHNVVTPHSWPAPTSFAGKPRTENTAAKDISSYVHSLVHRSEGINEGEFGTGFNNSRFWIRSAGNQPVFPHVLEFARDIAEAVDSERAKEAVDAMGEEWSPLAFGKLCEQTIKSHGRKLKQARASSEPLLTFCERVQGYEMACIVEYCVEQAGGSLK